MGKNKTSPSPIGDYVSGAVKFAPLADYLVINVSSPNTPGLRDMQGKATLEALLDAVLDKLNSLPAGSRRPPLLIKIAPDLANGDVDDVVDVLLQRYTKFDVYPRHLRFRSPNPLFPFWAAVVERGTKFCDACF